MGHGAAGRRGQRDGGSWGGPSYPRVDAWGAMAIGLLVYLILEANVKSRALYQRRKTHNSPDAESTLASLVTVRMPMQMKTTIPITVTVTVTVTVTK